MTKMHIVYIPGLGDTKPTGQRLAVASWQIFGVKSSLFQMRWEDKEPFEPKLKRLLVYIDELDSQGYSVALSASSAGASAALNAYSKRKNTVHAVGLLCGKVNNPQTVHTNVYQKNPAFKDSMNQVAVSLATLDSTQRNRILSIMPLSDMSVPPADTFIEGAVKKTNWTFGHVPSIAIGITLLSYRIVRFLKKQA